MLHYPTLTDEQIGDKLNVSRSSIWRIRSKSMIAIDRELSKKVAGKFLTEFQLASDYFKSQITRLEHLKQQTDEISEILAIEKQQTELWKNILFFARQGEAIEVMRLMQSGRIPITDQ